MKKLLMMALILMPMNVLAGDGHDHGESAFAGGAVADRIRVSDFAQQNIGLKTQVVQKTPFKDKVSLPCMIKNPPEQTSQLHTTYLGEVRKIYVRVGDKVQKGQELYSMFSMKAVREMPIVAPIDGIVSAQNVSLGQIVQMETTLAEISSNEYFLAEGFAYLSDDISHIKIGEIADISIDGTHEDIKGTVQGFMPNVNNDSKTKSILVEFKSDDEHIFPNMHCAMEISFGEEKEVISLPSEAILGEMGHYFVFLKEGDEFIREDVILGRRSGSQFEIVEGVHAGDEVVVQGNYQLQYITNAPTSAAAEEKIEAKNEHDDHEHEHAAEPEHNHDEHGHEGE